MNTPVVVLVFNRPDCTARLLERLALIKPRRIYLVADGARPGKPGEAERVDATRRLFDNLPWECHITRNLAPRNLGCANRVSSGISWVFEHEEEAIILEDDCLPNESFFRFCEELLERYRTDARVGAICGTDFTFGFPRPAESYYFSRYNLFWGWATWRRAWKHYDHALTPLTDGTIRPILRSVFQGFRPRLYWRMILSKTYSGRLSSWGYRWFLSCWRSGMLGILPSANLVENIGVGSDSTHTKGHSYGTQSMAELEIPLIHPETIERDIIRDDVIENLMYSRSFAQRIRWIGQKLGLLRPAGRA